MRINHQHNENKKEKIEMPKDVQGIIRERIPVVFSVDNHYALYLSVTIRSILEHSSPKNDYELIVMEEDLSESNKQLIASVIEGKNNFSIHFQHITLFENHERNLFQTASYISSITYCRLFIADLLKDYNKIIYLDSDLIIKKDLSNLFEIDVENSYLAAGHEWICLSRSFRRYLKASLRLRVPCEEYFAAGHLVMNLKKIRNDQLLQKFMQVLQEKKHLRAADQDVLNLVCQGMVVFLPPEWNICWHWKECLSPCLLEKYHAYGSPGTRPALIHYASDRKPWNSPEKELADQWWLYANMLPFKEEIQKKALEDRCRFLQNNYDMIVNSIPWKITKPLRNFYDFVKFDLPEILKLLTGQRNVK